MINVTLFESLVCEKDFLEKNYPDHHHVVNVLANDGKLYRHHRYAGERELLVKIADTPIRFVDKTQMSERRQIVPGGIRIPMSLLKDIESFFRAFMAKHASASRAGHGDYEAMALILYNLDTEEYRVSIPAQSVSKASVSYTIDDKADNEIVVVDIHSHNSMGAFFSGVDDRDDRSGAWVTGVLGKLDQPEFASVWRFNAGTTKIQLTIADIFETPRADVREVDPTWMDKVKIGYVYSGTPYYQRPVGGAQVGGKVGGAQVGGASFPASVGAGSTPAVFGGTGKKTNESDPHRAGFGGNLDNFDNDAYYEFLELLNGDPSGNARGIDDPFVDDEFLDEKDLQLVEDIDLLMDQLKSDDAYRHVVESILERNGTEEILVDIAADIVERITDGISDLGDRGIYVIQEPEHVVDAMASMCGEYLNPEQIATAFNEIADAQGIQYVYTPKE